MHRMRPNNGRQAGRTTAKAQMAKAMPRRRSAALLKQIVRPCAHPAAGYACRLLAAADSLQRFATADTRGDPRQPERPLLQTRWHGIETRPWSIQYKRTTRSNNNPYRLSTAFRRIIMYFLPSNMGKGMQTPTGRGQTTYPACGLEPINQHPPAVEPKPKQRTSLPVKAGRASR